jgi:hypothetical protein
VLALSDLIEFLLELMRDPAVAAEFENDPEGVLAERGLQGVTAQDVRDARLELCDAGGASATGDAAPPSGDDPVREINHTATNYTAAPQAQAVAHEHSALALHAANPVTIDDRDTFIFQNDFSDDDTTIVNDSFNTDNSVVNNDVTAINDSFNAVDNSTDNSVVENDVVAINAENSFNDAGGPVEPGAPAVPDGTPIPVEADGGTGAAPDADQPTDQPGTDEPGPIEPGPAADGPAEVDQPDEVDPFPAPDPAEDVPADSGADDPVGSGAEPEAEPDPAFDPVA